MSTALTIGDSLRFLLGSDDLDNCPRWTPDAFAVSAALLQRSGAYRVVVSNWPPHQHPNWKEDITNIGKAWRKTAAADQPVPPPIDQWWEIVRKHLGDSVESISAPDQLELAQTLTEICTAADEASADAGTFIGALDDFSRQAQLRLQDSRGRTLCRRVHPSRAVVLPKLHTPQRGLTMRSVSHYLSLYLAGQIRPCWHNLPWSKELQNVLILPWPLTFDPARFRKSMGQPVNMPPNYGYFTYDLDFGSRGFDMQDARDAIEAARREVGSIDAVVFPEMALRPEDPVDLCNDMGIMVIAGVGRPPYNQFLAKNSAAVAVPTTFEMSLVWKQLKHHRWQLDDRQIRQYGLEHILDPNKLWWEHIEMRERAVNFLTLNNEVTLAALICEDLARLDPVNELLATVGPTLVIALLMDGPPVNRWPDRYATVLADDPGISVLTVTSLGMARTFDTPTNSVVALWKDAKNPRKWITMTDPKAVGVVIRLKAERHWEFTADGRDDYGETFYLTMDGDPVQIVSSSAP